MRDRDRQNGGRPSIRKKAWITATAVVLASAGTVGVMKLAGFGRGQGIDPSSLAGLHLGRVDTVNLTSTSSTQAGLSARTTKEEFTTVGVTWNQATTQLNGTVQVRTKSVATGQWSGWQSLDHDDIGAPDGHASRGGTDPMWVGLSDGIQVRVRAAGGSASLPPGLNVALVDPNSRSTTSLMAYAAPAATSTDTASPTSSPTGTTTPAPTSSPTAAPTDTATAAPSVSASPTDTATAAPSVSASPTSSASATASASASASPSPTATPQSELPTPAQAYPAGCSNSTTPQPLANPPANTTSPIPMPPIVTRAGWGANECIRKPGYPAYGQAAKVVFVHHTDDPNSYTCADSPALVRAAYLYHVQTEGWNDIGYNFLVDKCGTIFEGRFGSPWLPVTGAQTYGFNTNSAGIAAIGTYTDLSGGDSSASTNAGATPTAAMLHSIAWIAAWKLGMSNLNPASGTSVLHEGGTEPVSEQKYAYGTNVTFKVISGHRDGWNTDCPGNQLYNDLATIRSYAGNPANFQHVISTIDGGAVKFNSEWVTRSAATVHWTMPTTNNPISGFEVLVDGVSVAKAASTASSAAITLSGSGTHQVVVQTDYTSGTTMKSPAVPVVVDTTAPTFTTAPTPVMRTGTVYSTSIPVTVGWAARDNTAIARFNATSPSSATFGASATSWNTSARPGVTNVYTVKATDIVGNASTSSSSRSARIILSGSGYRTGSWSRHTGSVWLGGYSYWARTYGASISFTFTGRAVSLIATRAPSTGGAYVYVDGVRTSWLNLYKTSTSYNQAVWTRHWSASGRHTVKIVVWGTAGHPIVPIDGLAVLG